MVVILGLGGVNWLGVKQGAGLQVTVTVLKVTLFAAVICCGLFLGQAHAATSPHPSRRAEARLAFLRPWWPLCGPTTVGTTSAWCRERFATRNEISRCPLILGTLAVILIYLCANVAYFAVLPASAVASSNRVAAEMMRGVFGSWGAGAVSFAAMISIFAALNGSILTGSRVPYALARDGYFFPLSPKFTRNGTCPAFQYLRSARGAAVIVLSGRFRPIVHFGHLPELDFVRYGSRRGTSTSV